MSKKKKRKRAPVQPTGRNRHHLLFQGRHWNVGMAKELRNYFIYYVPIRTHNELHNHVLHDVPKPPPDALKPLHTQFLADKWQLDHMDIIDALEWLEMACDYAPFRDAIRKQRDFFESHQ